MFVSLVSGEVIRHVDDEEGDATGDRNAFTIPGSPKDRQLISGQDAVPAIELVRPGGHASARASTILTRVQSRSGSRDDVSPMPLCFHPANGRPGAPPRSLLMYTYPASSSRAMSCARTLSVQIVAVSPYSTPFAIFSI